MDWNSSNYNPYFGDPPFSWGFKELLLIYLILQDNKQHLLSYLDYPREKGKLMESRDFDFHCIVKEKEREDLWEQLQIEGKEQGCVHIVFEKLV